MRGGQPRPPSTAEPLARRRSAEPEVPGKPRYPGQPAIRPAAGRSIIRALARTRKKGTPTMSDRLTAHRPPTIRNHSTRTRRSTIGTAAVIPALLIGVLGSTHSDPPHDSGLVACTYPLSTQDVPRPTTRRSAPSSPAHAGQTCATPAPPTSIWPRSYPPRRAPTDTRPSGSTSGCPPPARSTDSERQHMTKLLRDL